MTVKPTPWIAAAALCAGVLAAPAALAQGTFTPGYGTTTNCNVGASGSAIDSKTCSVGTVSATMTAWGFTGTTLTSTASAGFRQGAIADWNTSGIGVLSGNKETSAGSHHAFDNVSSGCGTTTGSTTVGSVTLSTSNSGCGGSIEALLLNFGSSKVNLTNVGIGWDNNVDTDLSVWAWTGTNGPSMLTQTAAGSASTAASMAGWTLVSNLDMGLAAPVAKSTGGTLYSSYFLITTYFGATTTSFNAGNDAFKLNSFTAATCAGTLSTGTGTASICTTSQVSEPGSLALAGIAFLGVAVARRRKATPIRQAA